MHVRRRYRKTQELIPEQIEILQKDRMFREQCHTYYEKGYKDWHLLGGIYNCMITWTMRKSGYDPFLVPQDLPVESWKQNVKGNSYAAWVFLDSDFDLCRKTYDMVCLKSYGFEVRRPTLKPAVLNTFLRERMMHFEIDLPHDPLFGEPPGDWPETG